MNHLDISIHQTTPKCMVYYTIRVGDFIVDGDALDVSTALKQINYRLKWELERFEDEVGIE